MVTQEPRDSRIAHFASEVRRVDAEQCGDAHALTELRDVEGSLPPIVKDRGRRSTVQENAHDVKMPLACGVVQRREAMLPTSIQLRTAVKKR
jgi:hypothetical protein